MFRFFIFDNIYFHYNIFLQNFNQISTYCLFKLDFILFIPIILLLFINLILDFLNFSKKVIIKCTLISSIFLILNNIIIYIITYINLDSNSLNYKNILFPLIISILSFIFFLLLLNNIILIDNWKLSFCILVNYALICILFNSKNILIFIILFEIFNLLIYNLLLFYRYNLDNSIRYYFFSFLSSTLIIIWWIYIYIKTGIIELDILYLISQNEYTEFDFIIWNWPHLMFNTNNIVELGIIDIIPLKTLLSYFITTIKNWSYLMLLGFILKLGLFPFHWPIYNIYIKFNNSLLFYTLSIYKISILILYMYAFIYIIAPTIPINILNYIAILTTFIGAIFLNYQTNLKNFIVANSIIHLGTIFFFFPLVNNIFPSEHIYSICLMYIFFYILIVLLIFSILFNVLIYNNNNILKLNNYVYNLNIFKVLFYICLLSTFPPFILFLLKYYLLYISFSIGLHMTCFLLIIINSTLVVWGYLKMMGYILLKYK